MAGIAGLEPTNTESKSVVLPLHYIPMCKKSIEKDVAPALSGVEPSSRRTRTSFHFFKHLAYGY